MKKFIALVALVLVSASTMMYAQESNAAARRAERKAQRDAERAKLRAEEEVQDMFLRDTKKNFEFTSQAALRFIGVNL